MAVEARMKRTNRDETAFHFHGIHVNITWIAHIIKALLAWKKTAAFCTFVSHGSGAQDGPLLTLCPGTFWTGWDLELRTQQQILFGIYTGDWRSIQVSGQVRVGEAWQISGWTSKRFQLVFLCSFSHRFFCKRVSVLCEISWVGWHGAWTASQPFCWHSWWITYRFTDSCRWSGDGAVLRWPVV